MIGTAFVSRHVFVEGISIEGLDYRVFVGEGDFALGGVLGGVDLMTLAAGGGGGSRGAVGDGGFVGIVGIA